MMNKAFYAFVYLLLALMSFISCVEQRGDFNAQRVPSHPDGGIYIKEGTLGSAVQDTIHERTTVTNQQVRGTALTNGTQDFDTMYLTGPEVIKTRIYRQKELQSFKIVQDDTSALGDSASVKYVYFSGSRSNYDATTDVPDSTSFTRIDSIIVDGQALTDWVYTLSDTARRPNDDFFFLLLSGTADNKTLSAVSTRILYNGKGDRDAQ